MSVSYGGDSITFADSSTISSGWTGFKNRIINGAMAISQRNAGNATTCDNAEPYTLDRWVGAEATDGVYTVTQVVDAPTGHYYSAKCTVTTADTSIGSSQYAFFRQKIEGYNISDLAWGGSSASPVTVSFWVKSSLVGQYSVTLINGTADRAYPLSYTILQANTWEYKTLTFPGFQTGSWNTTNGIGVYVDWGLAAGSTQVGPSGTLVSGGYVLAATGQVNWLATVGNTFYITGVQFEKGSTASSFEYRPYGTELGLCQRYYVGNYEYYFTAGYDEDYTTQNNGGLSWTYQMRTTPAVVVSGGGMMGHHGIMPTCEGVSRNGAWFRFSGSALRTGTITAAQVSFTLNAEL